MSLNGLKVLINTRSSPYMSLFTLRSIYRLWHTLYIDDESVDAFRNRRTLAYAISTVASDR